MAEQDVCACLLNRIVEEARSVVEKSLPDVRVFVGDTLFEDFELQVPVPKTLPVVSHVSSVVTRPDDLTASLVEAIIAAKDVVEWQQSYSQADGFDEDYLNRYGWFNLISPDGPFLSENLRVSVGFWGEGLYYKEHWHEPEELYLVLSGAATFISQGREPRDCTIGEAVFHESNQPHAIDMTPGPLLAMAFWRGNKLVAKPGLPEQNDGLEKEVSSS